MERPPLDTLGKYEIRGTLGRGAMGTVYEGWDPHIARRVAIKTVRLPDSSDAEGRDLLNRFRQEAQAAGRLQHPNVVGVFDYAETGELAYIVMEYVDGRTLQSLLTENPTPTLGQIGRTMAGLLAGLDYSHSHGVIHRDIKPANIIVSPAGVVKIADFGIARITGSGMTLAGTIMGTPAYMSPEQFKADQIDTRTDLYAAGVVLFQLLTGKRPFEGSMATIMHAVLTQSPDRPSAITPGIDPALDAVVVHAMARDPANRFQSAAEFDKTLQAALRGEPITLPQPSLPIGLGDLFTDATIVSPSRTVAVAQALPAPVTLPPAPAARPVKTSTPIALAALGLLVVTGAAAFLFKTMNEPAPTKTAATTSSNTPQTPEPAGPPPEPPASGTTQSAPPPADTPPITAPTPPTPPTPNPPPKSDPIPIHTPEQLPPEPQPPPPPPEPPRPTPPAPPPPPEPPVARIPSVASAGAALSQVPCTAIGGEQTPQGTINLRGVLLPGTEAAIRKILIENLAGMPMDLQLAVAQGPYCPTLDALRPYVRPLGSTNPSLGLAMLNGRTELIKDNPIVPRVTMPEFPAYLQLDYISSNGTVVHIHQALPGQPYPAASSPIFGRGGPNDTAYKTDEPFGTDLVIAIASTNPLFDLPRPVTEEITAYMPALQVQLENEARQGKRVTATILMLRTAPR